jgi:hypothetical protein
MQQALPRHCKRDRLLNGYLAEHKPHTGRAWLRDLVLACVVSARERRRAGLGGQRGRRACEQSAERGNR